MIKIEWLFEKDENWRATNKIARGLEWVINDSIPTIKWDGCCCAIIKDRFYKRHRLKEGKPMPFRWIHHTLNPEQKTGHGWKPITDDPADQYFLEGLANSHQVKSQNEYRTFELVGSKINKCKKHYPEIWERGIHILKQHGMDIITDLKSIDYETIKQYLTDNYIEGIVFHRISEKGYAKASRKHFGLSW